MSASQINRINEDFLDSSEDIIQVDNSMHSDVYFNGSYNFKHPFMFIVNVDLSMNSTEECCQVLNNFFDKLHETLDNCPFVRNFDRFRTVNTTGYFFMGQKHELLKNGLQFIAETPDVLENTKNNTWFNTTISIDCKDDFSSILRLIPCLYRVLTTAVKHAFSNYKSLFSFRYDDRIFNRKYTYPGSLQVSGIEKKYWTELNLDKNSIMKIETRSALLNAMLSFHPTNNIQDVIKYADDIKRLSGVKFTNNWEVTQKDIRNGITKSIICSL